MSDKTAARFPAHGSSAMGLGRNFFFRFLDNERPINQESNNSTAADLDSNQ
jgi:hypothetical protein